LTLSSKACILEANILIAEKLGAYGQMDTKKETNFAIIVGLILLSLFCLVAYLSGKDEKSNPQAEIQLQVTATILQQNLLIVATPEGIVLQSPPMYSTTGSEWRFLKFNLKEVGLFESVDTPGLIIKAVCQQPGKLSPTAGTLYRLDEQGILTPVDENKKLQNFATK
jgi:hypothetical protein